MYASAAINLPFLFNQIGLHFERKTDMRANGAPLHVASELVSIHLLKITASYKSSYKGSQYVLCESTAIELKAGQLQPVPPCLPSFPLERAGVVEVLPNCMPSTPPWALSPLGTETAPAALCEDREGCQQARVHAHWTRDGNCQSQRKKVAYSNRLIPVVF